MKKVCFVCLGNICRSPMAEFVMKKLVGKRDVLIESRATSSWEHGNPIHRGTQNVFKQHAIFYDTSKVSQQISLDDMERFDYILGMDQQNVEDLRNSFPAFSKKIHLFIAGGVPDPWYTGDFEETYALVESGCRNWLCIIDSE
ncbi:low molecular weight protein-tyrosine-phosphatase [Streptococcus dentasini]